MLRNILGVRNFCRDFMPVAELHVVNFPAAETFAEIKLQTSDLAALQKIQRQTFIGGDFRRDFTAVAELRAVNFPAAETFAEIKLQTSDSAALQKIQRQTFSD